MDVTFLDEYLLYGRPPKQYVIDRLLAERQAMVGGAGFYAGMEMLGSRTPDLTLMALRLALAGHRADDDAIVRLREICERSRAGGEGARQAASDYYAQVGSGSHGTTG